MNYNKFLFYSLLRDRFNRIAMLKYETQFDISFGFYTEYKIGKENNIETYLKQNATEINEIINRSILMS
jgi:hypothetical protein